MRLISVREGDKVIQTPAIDLLWYWGDLTPFLKQ